MALAVCAQPVEIRNLDPIGNDTRALNVTVENTGTDKNVAGSVAGYFTNNRWSYAPAFGLVAEVNDVLGVGPVWGQEIDILSVGIGITPDSMQRRGLGIVIGTRGFGATVGYGIDILPYYPSRGLVDVAYGLNVGIHCRIACVSVPSGEKITLSGDGVISIRYNPATGAIELLRGDVVKHSFPM